MLGYIPKLSIGVPVFNGDAYLAQALASILRQTFPDFEVILSDNASTDRTGEICRSHAARQTDSLYTKSGQCWRSSELSKSSRPCYWQVLYVGRLR